MIFDWAINSKGNATEPPKIAGNGNSDNAEYCPLCDFLQASRRKDEMIDQMRDHKNREVQRWQVVMNISHPSHDEERYEVQSPANESDFTNIKKVVPFVYKHCY